MTICCDYIKKIITQVLKQITVKEAVLGVFDCATLTMRVVNDVFKERSGFKEDQFRRMRVWCIMVYLAQSVTGVVVLRWLLNVTVEFVFG